MRMTAAGRCRGGPVRTLPDQQGCRRYYDSIERATLCIGVHTTTSGMVRNPLYGPTPCFTAISESEAGVIGPQKGPNYILLLYHNTNIK